MSTEREPLSNSVGARAHPHEARANTVVADATSEPRSDAPGRVRANEKCSAVVVVAAAPKIATLPPHTATHHAGAAQRDVHVAPNLRELVTAAPLATSQEAQAAKERRDLNEVVHGVLIIGLAMSTALMLAGVGLDLFYQRDLPTAVPSIGEVVGRVLALRPSGFLALGLLVLIATPILRVIGSIGAFLYECDWRFAGVTTVVLVVLVVSLLLGRG